MNWSASSSGWAAPRERTTATGNKSEGRLPRAARIHAGGPGIVLFLSLLSLPAIATEGPLLTLHANAAGADVPLTIELFRWSSDAERAPMLAALAPPAPAPLRAPAPEGGARGAAARGGRAGRGGRCGCAAAPP